MRMISRTLVATGMLAVLASGASAQTISTSAGEITFSGLFTTDGPDGIPNTADDVLGAPLATTRISGVGYLTGGAFFSPGPGFPLSPVYRAGQPNTEVGANYTLVFSAGSAGTPGVITDPFTGPGDPSVVTEYTIGTLTFYRVADAAGPTNNNYGTGSPADRGTFADGSIFLQANVSFLRSAFDPRFGQGSVSGLLTFTGGELYTSFLLPRGITTGTINAQTNLATPNTGGTPNTVNNPTGGTYDFVADGRIDVSAVPEPGTTLLLAAGLVPLVAVLRRRRAAK
jgi:hypothetical protein